MSVEQRSLDAPSRRRVLAVLEGRGWLSGGTVMGRQRAAALDLLARDAEVTLALRACPTEPGGQPIVAEASGVLFVNSRDGLRGLWRQWRASDSVLVYLPGVVSLIPVMAALMTGKPLVCVVVGDPVGALSADVVPGLRGWLARAVVVRTMHVALRHAAVVRYVTQSFLQERYPARAAAVFSATDTQVEGFPAVTTRSTGRCKVLTVGTLERPYKGIPDLIGALERVATEAEPLELCVAGSGVQASALESRSPWLAVTLLGQLDAAGMSAAYADADLFALASWTEGLPRTLVEAMAVGLPCMATDVGGVAELLAPRFLATPRDVESLVGVAADLLTHRDEWAMWGAENQETIRALLLRAAEQERAFVREVIG